MKILVLDDDAGVRQAMDLLLRGDGHDVAVESSAKSALDRAAREPYDVILSDVRMPDMDGLAFLRAYRASGGTALVIMMSAYGGEDAAVEAMKEGAYDYLSKPFRPDEVLLTLRKAAEREKLRGQVATLEAELARWRDRDVVADSPAMRKVMDLVRRVAPHTTTVLITGESGTGKEVVARAIHRLSPRHGAPFVAVNCAAIPEALLESELFGHVRGAFTGATTDHRGLFEEATGGTLLLDEVGDLPLALQGKLLRALQESEVRRVGDNRPKRVDVRLLAATARDLEADVREKRFREDLFYRLNVVHVHLPPVRERPEDLDGLVAVMLDRSAERSGRRGKMSAEGMEAVRRYPWPGNVRQLENAIERAVVLSPDGVLGPEAFPKTDGSAALAVAPNVRPKAGVSLKKAVQVAEREAIEAALRQVDGNRAEAARLLGISLRTLFYKLSDTD
ncbi:MAG TPA: sigma-54 dependent transcriptional regulator [Gemmatimonadales bacterium]|jgi:two-component system response regulator AtoC